MHHLLDRGLVAFSLSSLRGGPAPFGAGVS